MIRHFFLWQRRLTGVWAGRVPVGRLLLLGAFSASLAGCQAAAPRTGAATRPVVPTEGSAALTEYIAEQPFVTVEPAYRSIYALWKGADFTGDFAALVAALRDGRIIASQWDYPPDALTDRGSVGYMICRACNIRSGLNWQLTGLGRYAWRELNYLGIVSPASEYGYVSGGQFVGILARAEDYLARRGQTVGGRVELGSPPPSQAQPQ
jgi:hypothetical protein